MLAVRQRFEKALLTLRRARFGAGGGVLAGWKAKLNGRYLYELPWYLIIGAPGSGKTTALRHSGLKFPLADVAGEDAIRGVGGTRNCDWWFTDQAVLIDTAGRFTTQDSDRENDRSTWSGFLAMLKRIAAAPAGQRRAGHRLGVRPADAHARRAAPVRGHRAPAPAGAARGPRHPLPDLPARHQGRPARRLHRLLRDPRQGPARDAVGRDLPASRPARRRTCSASATSSTRSCSASRTASSSGCSWSATRRSAPASTASPASSPACAASCRNSSRSRFSSSPYEADALLRGVYFVSGTQEGTPIDRVLGSIARSYRLERADHRAEPGERPQLLPAAPARRGRVRRERPGRHRPQVGAAPHRLAVARLCGDRRAHRRRARRLAGELREQPALRRRGRAAGRHRCASWCRARPTAPRPTCCRSCRRSQRRAASPAPATTVPWKLGFRPVPGPQARQRRARQPTSACSSTRCCRASACASKSSCARRATRRETQYEALKTYLMLHDVAALRPRGAEELPRAPTGTASSAARSPPSSATQLDTHLNALLAQGAAVSPLAEDKALVDFHRSRLAAVPLPQRIYDRMRQQGLGKDFPEFTVVRAAGNNAALVFTRPSGAAADQGRSGPLHLRRLPQGLPEGGEHASPSSSPRSRPGCSA